MNPSTALPTPPAAKASPLINRNFALLFGGAAISSLGDTFFNITLILWVTVTIARGQPWAPLAVSGVLVAAALPILLVGPLAGVFVDRWDKRRTMLAMDALRAVLVVLLAPLAAGAFALPLLPGGRLPLVWHFLATSCTQFFNPARLALVGDIVPEERRTQASGLLQTTMGLSFIIGPALAAPLYFAAGATWALAINALSFAGSFLALLAIRPPALLAPPAGAQRSSVLGELGAGISFFVRSRVLMTLLVTCILVMLGGGALNTLDVFFVTRNLHTPLSAYGVLDAVFGAGALLGAVLLSIFAQRIGTARTFWLSLLGIGSLMMVYARLTALAPALVVLFFVGVLNAGINIALGPIVLHVTPRALVGGAVTGDDAGAGALDRAGWLPCQHGAGRLPCERARPAAWPDRYDLPHRWRPRCAGGSLRHGEPARPTPHGRAGHSREDRGPRASRRGRSGAVAGTVPAGRALAPVVNVSGRMGVGRSVSPIPPRKTYLRGVCGDEWACVAP